MAEPYPTIDALVFVRYVAATQSLTFEGDPVVLQQGASVAWCFVDLPASLFPDIRFSVNHPFDQITFSPRVIVASGPRFSEPINVQVFLVGSPTGVQPASPWATLRPSSIEPVIHQFTVSLDPGNSSVLVVEPLSNELFTGQQIEWIFEPSCFDGGSPDRWQAEVGFTRIEEGGVSRTPTPEQAVYGPCEMFSKWHEFETDVEVHMLYSGNNHQPGNYYFMVAITDIASGTSEPIRRSAPDPVVDNRNGVDE